MGLLLLTWPRCHDNIIFIGLKLKHIQHDRRRNLICHLWLQPAPTYRLGIAGLFVAATTRENQIRQTARTRMNEAIYRDNHSITRKINYNQTRTEWGWHLAHRPRTPISIAPCALALALMLPAASDSRCRRWIFWELTHDWGVVDPVEMLRCVIFPTSLSRESANCV